MLLHFAQPQLGRPSCCPEGDVLASSVAMSALLPTKRGKTTVFDQVTKMTLFPGPCPKILPRGLGPGYRRRNIQEKSRRFQEVRTSAGWGLTSHLRGQFKIENVEVLIEKCGRLGLDDHGLLIRLLHHPPQPNLHSGLVI